MFHQIKIFKNYSCEIFNIYCVITKLKYVIILTYNDHFYISYEVVHDQCEYYVFLY